MGAWTDARVIPVSPVGEVVAAFLAGTRVIADFVGRDAGGGGALRGQFEEIGGFVGVQRFELVLGDHRREARAWLDG